MTSVQDIKEQTEQTASTAADEGKHVADVAVGEAKDIAGEAQDHIRGLLDETRSQVDEQSRQGRDRLVSTLQSVGEDLRRMASSDDTSGLAADAVRRIADRTTALGERLDGREPQEILDDVRGLARRHPGGFLLGALAAGIVTGRLVRGAKASRDAGPSSPLSNTPAASERAPARAPLSEAGSAALTSASAFEPLYPDTALGEPPLTDGGYVEPGTADASSRYQP